MGKIIDLTGQTFDRLTVVKRVENDKFGHAQWLCDCICGKTVITRTDSLKRGIARSCGCFRSELMSEKQSKHRMKNTRIYNIWQLIKRRTTNKNAHAYERYGGKGIKMCSEWLNDFEIFYKWSIENGYRDDLTIDRIDNAKGYCPSNCRWATYEVQNNNTSRNHLITYKGETHTMAEWAKIKNVSYKSLRNRIYKGWDEVEALERPYKK